MLVELPVAVPDPEALLTRREQARLARLGSRRRPSFLAARLALKRLAVTLGRVPSDASFPELQTVAPDGVRPHLPGVPDGAPMCCSVAHDDRFAVAVASAHPVGVDVERISPRLERVERMFVRPPEAARLPAAPAQRRTALARLWTLKEAVAKALGIPLLEAFDAVKLRALDTHRSRFSLRQAEHVARHAAIADHVFTLVCFEA
jgi:phosphopantetheine--protein transferase-like protein